MRGSTIMGLAGLPVLAGCTTSRGDPHDAITAIAGEAAIERFAAGRLKASKTFEPEPMYVWAPGLMAPPTPPPGPPAPAPAVVVTGAKATAPQDGVTNTQEAGVDEGGIVKRHGDHLVILRRGRLFTVATGGDTLAAIDTIDAFPPGEPDPGDTWYDEMLVAGDTVIVIGYSYGDEGTEISRFAIDDAGRLAYRDTHYLTSGDYYSSRNYASRLLGDRLLFYAPIRVDWSDWRASLPAVRRRAGDGSLDAPERATGATTLFVPARVARLPGHALDTLHTVTACVTGAADLSCRSTVVAGPEGRDFYFSAQAAYVWTDGADDGDDHADADADADADAVPAMLYHIPLDGGAPRAIGVRGTPIDQFSFREDADGTLDVLVRGADLGGGMWGGEVGAGALDLLHLSAGAFGDGAGDAPAAAYRPLPPVAGYRMFNRFVGRHLLYAGGRYGREAETDEMTLVPLDRPWVQRMRLPHGVTRLDALGDDAVAVGSAGNALGINSVRLDADSGAARLVDTFLLAGAEEGETRSQAFLFRADPATPAGEDGLLGPPISREIRADGGEFLGDAAAILYLRRTRCALADASTLDSAVLPGAAHEQDGCQASCVDWYGNARPLFIGDRVIALMGYELVEGREDDGRIVERRRVDFAPRPAKGSAP